MILDSFYKGEKINSNTKYRFDITASTLDYSPLNQVLTNKRGFNSSGGMSLNCTPRPKKWSPKSADLALVKGKSNITSIKRPNIESNVGYGDIKDTNDACLIIFNPDFNENGIRSIEIFIAKGYKNDALSLYSLALDGDLKEEMEVLRKKAKQLSIT